MRRNEINGKGEFWCISKPETKLLGHLRAKENEEITLEIHEAINKEILDDIKNTKKLIGDIEGIGEVTLFHLIVPGFDDKMILALSSKGITFDIGYLIIGAHYLCSHDLGLNEIVFSLSGLQTWLGISGINMEGPNESGRYEIHGTLLDNIKLFHSEEFNLFAGFDTDMHQNLLPRSIAVNENAYLKLTSDTTENFSWFEEKMILLKFLFTLIYNKPVLISSIRVNSKELSKRSMSGRNSQKRLDMLISSHHSPTIRMNDYVNPCFRFQSLLDTHIFFENVFNKFTILRRIISFFVLTKDDSLRYLDFKFLTQCHAIEGFHRTLYDGRAMNEKEFEALRAIIIENVPAEHKDFVVAKLKYANEISLKKRIIELLKPFNNLFSNNKEMKNLAYKIADYRNKLVHLDGKSNNLILSNDFVEVALRLDAIFRMVLFNELGIQTNKASGFEEHEWNI